MIPGGPERPATSPGRTGPAPPHSVSGKPASIARGSSCSSANVWTCGTIQESHGLLPRKPPGGDTLPCSAIYRTRAHVARQGIGTEKETSPPAKGGAELSRRPLWERREGAGADFPAQWTSPHSTAASPSPPAGSRAGSAPHIPRPSREGPPSSSSPFRGRLVVSMAAGCGRPISKGRREQSRLRFEIAFEDGCHEGEPRLIHRRRRLPRHMEEAGC